MMNFLTISGVAYNLSVISKVDVSEATPTLNADGYEVPPLSPFARFHYPNGHIDCFRGEDALEIGKFFGETSLKTLEGDHVFSAIVCIPPKNMVSFPGHLVEPEVLAGMSDEQFSRIASLFFEAMEVLGAEANARNSAKEIRDAAEESLSSAVLDGGTPPDLR
jgi:hypothetical protein